MPCERPDRVKQLPIVARCAGDKADIRFYRFVGQTLESFLLFTCLLHQFLRQGTCCLSMALQNFKTILKHALAIAQVTLLRNNVYYVFASLRKTPLHFNQATATLCRTFIVIFSGRFHASMC